MRTRDVLGPIRTMSANRQVMGDEKLVFLVAFPVLSSGLAAVIARTFSDPLNRTLRSSL